jgi:hypothetical protein
MKKLRFVSVLAVSCVATSAVLAADIASGIDLRSAPGASTNQLEEKTSELQVDKASWELRRNLKVGAFVVYKSSSNDSVMRHEVLAVEPAAVIVQVSSDAVVLGSRMRMVQKQRFVPAPAPEAASVTVESLMIAGKRIKAERSETKMNGEVVMRSWTSDEIPVLSGGVVKSESGGMLLQEVTDFGFGESPAPRPPGMDLSGEASSVFPIPRGYWEKYQKLRVGAFVETKLLGGGVSRSEVLESGPKAVIVLQTSMGTTSKVKVVPAEGAEAPAVVTETFTVAGRQILAERTELAGTRLWSSKDVPSLLVGSQGLVRSESNGKIDLELIDFGHGR